MTKLLNGYVAEKKVPLSWKNASVVLTHTKWNTGDIKKHKSISLLPVTYNQQHGKLAATRGNEEDLALGGEILVSRLGPAWSRVAHDRGVWKSFGKKNSLIHKIHPDFDNSRE